MQKGKKPKHDVAASSSTKVKGADKAGKKSKFGVQLRKAGDDEDEDEEDEDDESGQQS